MRYYFLLASHVFHHNTKVIYREILIILLAVLALGAMVLTFITGYDIVVLILLFTKELLFSGS